MNHNQDLWRCEECGNHYGRLDLWFDGMCEPCNEMNKPRCRGCDSKENVQAQFDAYGYSTGDWCDECYSGDKYPYRKDRYFDPSLANERLDDNY